METISRVVTRATFVGVTDKTPPALMVRKRATGAGGAVRHFTFMFPVLDPDLLRRLTTEVHPGDEVEATVVNVWREDGHTARLESFCKVTAEADALPAKELAAKELASQAA